METFFARLSKPASVERIVVMESGVFVAVTTRNVAD
jgi:hypothetical protein